MGSLELGEELTGLARLGQKEKISCYKLAGANLNSVNLSKQTALHSAVETGQIQVVQFLIEHDVDAKKKDIFGHTPLDIAKLLNHIEIENILVKYLE
jgi:ankyrin repeat protein